VEVGHPSHSFGVGFIHVSFATFKAQCRCPTRHEERGILRGSSLYPGYDIIVGHFEHAIPLLPSFEVRSLDDFGFELGLGVVREGRESRSFGEYYVVLNHRRYAAYEITTSSVFARASEGWVWD